MEGFVIVWLLLSIGVAMLGNARGRSGIGFFLLALLLSPLIGLIVVLVMRDEKAAEEADRRRRRDEEIRLEEVRAMSGAPFARAASMPAHPAPVSAPAPAASQPRFSAADEIIKLAGLRDQGLLTQDEFKQQRDAVLKRGL